MTRKLTIILIVLILLFIAFITYLKYDFIRNYITTTYDNIFIGKIETKEPNNYKRPYKFLAFTETDNFYPENENDIKNIFYTILNNGWGEFKFYCPKKYENCATDAKNIANDDEFISLINNYVNPFNSYKSFNTVITDNKEIFVKIEHLYSQEDIEQINNALDNVFLSLKPNTSNPSIEDIRNLHHYLIYNVEYDDDYPSNPDESISNKANGALINKKAICSGYSDSFALMLDRINIVNFKVSNESHVWNIVKTSNGWLHVDVTWDDDEVNTSNYNNFFMITTDKLYELNKDEHLFKKELYLELNQ